MSLDDYRKDHEDLLRRAVRALNDNGGLLPVDIQVELMDVGIEPSNLVADYEEEK